MSNWADGNDQRGGGGYGGGRGGAGYVPPHLRGAGEPRERWEGLGGRQSRSWPIAAGSSRSWASRLAQSSDAYAPAPPIAVGGAAPPPPAGEPIMQAAWPPALRCDLYPAAPHHESLSRWPGRRQRLSPASQRLLRRRRRRQLYGGGQLRHCLPACRQSLQDGPPSAHLEVAKQQDKRQRPLPAGTTACALCSGALVRLRAHLCCPFSPRCRRWRCLRRWWLWWRLRWWPGLR